MVFLNVAPDCLEGCGGRRAREDIKNHSFFGIIFARSLNYAEEGDPG